MRSQLLTSLQAFLLTSTVLAGQSDAPPDPIAETATRLTQLHQDKQWPQARSLLNELFSGDRTFAARVISIPIRYAAIETRLYLIDKVRRAGLKEIAPTLILLLDDSKDVLRASSASALGDLGDHRAVEPLERLLARETDVLQQHKIRASLAKLGRPYLKYFFSGLADRDRDRRYRCIGALGTLKDKRAVPHLLKIVEENTDTWNPVHGASCITEWNPVHAAVSIREITGVEDTVIKTIQIADGSVSTRRRIRPKKEFKADCLAWIAQHRDEVSRPIEKPAEPWQYSPEPLLPGLDIAFNMDARQVKKVYRDAELEYRYNPEKHWEKRGTGFYKSEELKATKTLLPSLNRGLISIRYIFERNRLDRIYVERIGQRDSVIQPLVKPLKLHARKDGSWSGLNGSIIVEPGWGNAEKETYVIRLKRWREAAN